MHSLKIYILPLLRAEHGFSLGRVLPGPLWGEAGGQIDVKKMKEKPTLVLALLRLNLWSEFVQADGIDGSCIS
jgi:hypothetical protein